MKIPNGKINRIQAANLKAIEAKEIYDIQKKKVEETQSVSDFKLLATALNNWEQASKELELAQFEAYKEGRDSGIK